MKKIYIFLREILVLLTSGGNKFERNLIDCPFQEKKTALQMMNVLTKHSLFIKLILLQLLVVLYSYLRLATAD